MEHDGMRSPRLYVYKLTADNGGAPCIKNGLLSLAICKPQVRRTAKPGDWIFGFGGKPLKGRLIYIARVTKCVKEGRYYTVDREDTYNFKERADRIYRYENGEYKLRRGAKYHSDGNHVERDLGKDYSNAVTLLSDNFRYWGKRGKSDYRKRFGEVAEVLDRLTQGHRVNLSERVVSQLLALQRSQWEAYPNRMVLGSPSESDCSKPCADSEGNVVSREV